MRLGVRIFSDFVNPKEARKTKTHRIFLIIRQIRQASVTGNFNGKLNLRINRRARQSGNGQFLGPNGVLHSYQSDGK